MTNVTEMRQPEKSAEQKAFDNYNIIARENNLPVARFLTPKRRAALKDRLALIGGIEVWNEALGRVEASSFLTGKVIPRDGRKPFKASLDFLLQESSLIKLLEGNYDDE